MEETLLATKKDLEEFEGRFVKRMVAIAGLGVAILALIMDFQLGQ